MKNLKKKMKKVAPLALVGCLAVGGLGASAWLTTSDKDEHTHSITAGTFDVTLSGDTGFEWETAYPVTDAVGQAATAETEGVVVGSLKAENTGEVSMVARLAIATEDFYKDIEDDAKIAEDKIHVYITDEADAVVYNGLLSDADKDNGFGAVAILNAGESKTYTVRLYIDSNATNDDLYYDADGDADGEKEAAKSANFKLAVLSVQNDGGITTDAQKADGSASSASDIDETAFDTIATKAGLTR